MDAFVALPVIVLQAVLDRKISRDAGWLYAVLLSHLNWKRGEDTVWPKRETLAAEMGISKAANVDKYLTELQTQGFILIEHRRVGRMRTRNMYTLLHLPATRSPKTGTTEPPAETPETPGQPVVPETGQRSAEVGAPVGPESGPDLDESNQSNERPSSSARSSTITYVCTHTDADDDEAQKLIKKIKDTFSPRSVGAYIRAMPDGDLIEILDGIRNPGDDELARQALLKSLRDDEERGEHIKDVKNYPDCEHGCPGGHKPMRNGWVTCPQRRREQEKTGYVCPRCQDQKYVPGEPMQGMIPCPDCRPYRIQPEEH